MRHRVTGIDRRRAAVLLVSRRDGHVRPGTEDGGGHDPHAIERRVSEGRSTNGSQREDDDDRVKQRCRHDEGHGDATAQGPVLEQGEQADAEHGHGRERSAEDESADPRGETEVVTADRAAPRCGSQSRP